MRFYFLLKKIEIHENTASNFGRKSKENKRQPDKSCCRKLFTYCLYFYLKRLYLETYSTRRNYFKHKVFSLLLVDSFVLNRGKKDRRHIAINRDAAQGATGYIVRSGIGKNNIYNNYPVY